MNELMKKNIALEKEIRDQQDTTKKVFELTKRNIFDKNIDK